MSYDRNDACFCYGACFTGQGCIAFPTGCRNPDDPWGPLLDKPARPDIQWSPHSNHISTYGAVGEPDAS